MQSENIEHLAIVFGVGIGTLVLMLLLEVVIAARQNRRSQAGSVLLCGLCGVVYFAGLLYAAGYC